MSQHLTADIALENVVELATQPALASENIYPYEQPEENTVSTLEYAFHLLNGVRGRTVVDLGCGSGIHSVILAKLGAQVIAIDSSSTNLEKAGQRAYQHGVVANVTLVLAHGCRVPAADGIADRVLCQRILQYDDPLVIARQIRRILKPGGYAVFHETSGLISGMMRGSWISREYARMLSRAVGIPGSYREFRKIPLMRSLASASVWAARKES